MSMTIIVSSKSRMDFMKEYALWEINAFLWISLITVTYLLLNKVFRLFRLWSQGRKIPGPPCSSFYGHTHLLSRESLSEVLSKSHEKYGSVVKLWLGPTKLLVSIKDPELIREMLLKAEDKLPLTGKAFRLAFGTSSLFVSSFDKVQKGRELVAAELNGRLLERGSGISARVVECVMERIHDILDKGSIDCKIASQQMAFTMMGATIFGEEFLVWTKATAYEELLMMIAKDACFWASYTVTPFWKRGFWRYQQLCTKLKSLTIDILQECRRNYNLFCHVDHTFHNENANIGIAAASGGPFGSGVMKSDNFCPQELNGHLQAREEPSGNIVGMMFHGCLTTAGLVGDILARLATHKDIQDKIYSEIIMARKEHEKPDQQSIEEMPLLLATVYESARLLPAGPLLQRCSLKNDLILKTSATIPAEAVLIVPVQLVQMDDCNWGSDAAQFNPYRFLSKTKWQSDSDNASITGPAAEKGDIKPASFVLDDPNGNAAFLPFGAGRRACVGQKFVIQGVTALFASLLERYEIKLQPVSKSPKNDNVIKLNPSPEIVFVRRE